MTTTKTTKKKSDIHTSDYSVSKYGTDQDPSPYGTPTLRKKLKMIEWTSNGKEKMTSMEDYAALQRRKNLQVPDNKPIHVKDDGLVVKKKGLSHGSLVVTYTQFLRTRERNAQKYKKYEQSEKGKKAAATKNKNRQGRRIRMEFTVPVSINPSQKQDLALIARTTRDVLQPYVDATLKSQLEAQGTTNKTLLAMKQQDVETLRASIAAFQQQGSSNDSNDGRYTASDGHSKDGSDDLESEEESVDLESEEESDESESEDVSDGSVSEEDADDSASEETSADSKKQGGIDDSKSTNNTSRCAGKSNNAIDGGRCDDQITFKEPECEKDVVVGKGKPSNDEHYHDGHASKKKEGREHDTTEGERGGEDCRRTDASSVEKEVENEELTTRPSILTTPSFLNVQPIHPNGEYHDFDGIQTYITEHCKIRCGQRDIHLSELKNTLQRGREEANARHFEDVSHHGETRMFVCGFVTVITNMDKTKVVTAWRDPPSVHAEMQKPEIDVNPRDQEPIEVMLRRISCQVDDLKYYYSCKSVVDSKAAKDQEQRAEDLAYHEGERYGYHDGRRDGYREGRRDGYDDGHREGRRDGYDDGHREGRREGYDDGHREGRREGYDDGHADGYQEGREDEWNDLHPRPSQRRRR